jgi:ferredoxin-nitrite reductase
VPEAKLAALRADALFERFAVEPGPLERGLVSCTGSQFCGFGLIETKARAVAVVRRLEAELELPRAVRIHWTGCPNSCGQAQVADIGLMGAPAKRDGKAVEGVKIFLGGRVGEGMVLAEEAEAGVPAAEEILVPKLREILIRDFGATLRAGVVTAAAAV